MSVTFSDRAIALVVHKRLRLENIFIHRLLVRLITRHVLDLLTEQFPKVMADFLEDYRAGRHGRRRGWKRYEPKIAELYTERRMIERGSIYGAKIKSLRQNVYDARWRARRAKRFSVELTPDEVASLMVQREFAMHDEVARSALDKILAVHLT
jgi:hypothetical protein